MATQLPVKYIGFRDFYTDGCYSSYITWEKGQTIMVDQQLAQKMLRHPDVWVLGDVGPKDTKEGSATETEAIEVDLPTEAEKEEAEAEEEAANIETTKLNLLNMEPEDLRKFAEINFVGHKIPATITKKETLIEKINIMIDQYGLE